MDLREGFLSERWESLHDTGHTLKNIGCGFTVLEEFRNAMLGDVRNKKTDFLLFDILKKKELESKWAEIDV